MKVLITGGSGALGKALCSKFQGAYCPSHKEMDIKDPKAVDKAIAGCKPDVLIHTAAIVGVRDCEENKEKAWNTNVEGTQNIINSLKKLDSRCYLIYVSTACAFAGEKERYYTEEDVPSPKNYYSFTKVCGEIAVRQYPNACIIRTNFAPKGQWKYPKAFVDRFGTYLFPENIAQGISEVIAKREKGIIHIVGDKRMSMYELALLAGSKNLGKMTLSEYDGPAVTADMSLSTKRWKKYKIG